MRVKKLFFYPIEKAYSYVPPQIRYRPVYGQTYALLEKSLVWGKKQIEEYQFRQLQSVIIHAYTHVPFYRERFNSYGIKPSDIQNFDDVKKIPFLTKEDIINNVDTLKSTNMSLEKDGKLETTGGSSGAPLSFYQQKGYTRNRDVAFNWFYWNRMGINFRDTLGILRGSNLNIKSDIFERRTRHNSIILNSYQLSEKNYPEFIKVINKLQIKYIRAYPSTILLLAKYMNDQNISIKLKAVLTSSENLFDSDRGIINKAFQSKVFDLYGQTECVAYISQCEENDLYHVDPFYGYTELIELERNKSFGDSKEIVSTGFNNFFMPFIRYRTGDIAEESQEKCKCGFEMKTVKRIIGRDREYVITKSKKIITLTALIFAQHFYAFDRIMDMQIIQNAVGEIVVRILPKNNFSSSDEEEIYMKVKAAADNDLDIRIAKGEPEKTVRGKKLFLIQKLDLSSV